MTFMTRQNLKKKTTSSWRSRTIPMRSHQTAPFFRHVLHSFGRTCTAWRSAQPSCGFHVNILLRICINSIDLEHSCRIPGYLLISRMYILWYPYYIYCIYIYMTVMALHQLWVSFNTIYGKIGPFIIIYKWQRALSVIYPLFIYTLPTEA